MIHFDPRLIELIDIDAIEPGARKNMVDITVQDDESFTLADGIVSHNSAAKSIQGGRGKNPYIASFPLKGKPLNIRDKEVSRVLGLDKKKEKEAVGKKVEPNEIQKILMILGLQIGVPVETTPAPDGEWVEIEIDGKSMTVNVNDEINIDGKWVQVASLI